MRLSGWGRYPQIQAVACSFETTEELAALVAGVQECIVHGAGRSYGDAALAPQVILSRRFDRILHFEPQTGVVYCESGVTLKDLLEVFLPRGWLPAVLPGTKFVTVGGAIASDIHGKNHHLVGCFSEFVQSLELMLPSGEVVRCSREEHPALFHATCGGLGLTGVILTARLKLQPVSSAYIRESIIPCAHLEELIWRSEERRAATYSVAWVDTLAPGNALGRGVLFLGEPLRDGPLEMPPVRCFYCPPAMPGFTLNRPGLALFNRLFYHRAVPQERLVSLEQFFFPLDRLRHWNRLYGRQGFIQYHLVLPQGASLAGLQEILRRLRTEGLYPFLAVLKLCGPANENLLSFPLAGYSLALDFKIHPRLWPVLAELDHIVLDYGGRHYLTKDARLSPEVLRRSYPRLEEFLQLRAELNGGGKFTSLLARRLEL